MNVTFYHHSSLAAKLGVNAATHALDAHYWLLAAAGHRPLPDWADAREAHRQARHELRRAKWCQRHRA